MIDKKVKLVEGIISRVGPAYAMERLGLMFMLEGDSKFYSLNLGIVPNYFGLTKIGDKVSFSSKEKGLFKKYFEFDQKTFVNHTLLEDYNKALIEEKNKKDSLVYSLEK